MPDFEPDARLVADTYPITELPLCQLRLMDDARFPWLVLVPRRHEVSEVFELDERAQRQLWREATQVGRALLEALEGDKLNIASLGNVVAQLHVHAVVRRREDAAWPAPVWGHGRAEPYDPDALAAMRARILAELERLDLGSGDQGSGNQGTGDQD
ncbi:HIT family protein [Halomonas sp. CS7]|uniref:HIT family protein n=1 Tax=Halomonas pelophila TaxID=3151122 RepID=A0ABV1N3Q1_9GAMM